jgi:hypothetical protein
MAPAAHLARLGHRQITVAVHHMRVPNGVREEDVDGLTDQLVACVAELTLDSFIRISDDAGRINQQNPGRQRLGHETEQFAGIAR